MHAYVQSPGEKALSEVMGVFGHTMTPFETDLWTKLISDFGDDAIIQFLSQHVESSTFAPKPGEAVKMLDPGRRNSSSAYEALAREVSSCGPYTAPVFQDPAIAEAVLLLGGWAKVNEEMPALNGSFESTAHMKRFDQMYKQGCANLALNRMAQSKLRGLHDLRTPVQQLGYAPKPAARAGVGATQDELVIEDATDRSFDRSRT